MKRNTMIAFVALSLMLVVGAGASYWAIKKYRQKQRQEFRFEGTMGQAREGFDPKAFKERVLTDDILDKVVEKHQLVSAWGTGDTATAKARIREKFSIVLDGMTVKVRYQDKSKEMAQNVLQSIMQTYYKKLNPGQKVPTSP